MTSLFVELPTGEDDPRRRYERTCEAAERLKSSSAARGGSTLVLLTGLMPPLLHEPISQTLFAPRLFNLTVTNVPGPQYPLYSMGSRMRQIIPLVPLFADHSLGIAIVSYDGTLTFGLNADRRRRAGPAAARARSARGARHAAPPRGSRPDPSPASKRYGYRTQSGLNRGPSRCLERQDDGAARPCPLTAGGERLQRVAGVIALEQANALPSSRVSAALEEIAQALVQHPLSGGDRVARGWPRRRPRASTRSSSSAAGTTSDTNPVVRAQPASKVSPVRRSSRAAVSPSSSGRRSVPALVATSPIRTSGVPKRARSVQTRACSSPRTRAPRRCTRRRLPPGPGRGRDRRPREALEGLHGPPPFPGVGVERVEEVIAGREVLARTTHHDAARISFMPGALYGVCELFDQRTGPRVPAWLAVPAEDARRSQGRPVHVHSACSFRSSAPRLPTGARPRPSSGTRAGSCARRPAVCRGGPAAAPRPRRARAGASPRFPQIGLRGGRLDEDPQRRLDRGRPRPRWRSARAPPVRPAGHPRPAGERSRHEHGAFRRVVHRSAASVRAAAAAGWVHTRARSAER